MPVLSDTKKWKAFIHTVQDSTCGEAFLMMTMFAFKKRQIFLFGTALLSFPFLLDEIVFNVAADQANKSLWEFLLEKAFKTFRSA